jgi:hypothetical protein
MTDPATESAAVVTVTLADAIRLRDELRGVNHAISHMAGALMRCKMPNMEAATKEFDELVDRLTVAIHEAKRP